MCITLVYLLLLQITRYNIPSYMPLELVSQWLGHSSQETTLIYAYADTEHKREAIERALGRNTASTEQTPTVSDEELLKQLYGLRA